MIEQFIDAIVDTYDNDCDGRWRSGKVEADWVGPLSKYVGAEFSFCITPSHFGHPIAEVYVEYNGVMYRQLWDTYWELREFEIINQDRIVTIGANHD